MSTNWTRKDTAELAREAMQLGLMPEDTIEALTIGARMMSHGFSNHEISEMINNQYQIWVEEDEAMQSGKATVTQARRWWGRRKRDD